MSANDEFWSRKRESPLHWIVFGVRFVLVFAGFFTLESYGQRTLNLPVSIVPLIFGFVLVFGQLVTIAIHELSHCAIALALGFQFRIINIGPLTIFTDASGHFHSRLDWNELFVRNGYWGGVSRSENHVRSNMILVVLAGPMGSLLAGLSLWLVVLGSPGTTWGRAWDTIGLLAILFVVDFLAALAPIGYSDGTLLLHLLLWTRQGQDLLKRVETSKTYADAEDSVYPFEGWDAPHDS